MAFKDLLLQMSSYPDATPPAAIEQAIGFAEAFGSRLSALTFEIDIRVPSNMLANALLDIPGMVAAERARSLTNARDLVSAFESAAGKRNVACDHIVERCMALEIPEMVTEHARLRDLTMIPVGESTNAQQYIAECVIFGSGRPVLILPEVPKRKEPIALDTIGVAWDFSRPAARVIADALPLLQRAKTVHVVTVTNEKAIETRRSGSELARHLACHGVEIILDEEDAGGRSIGQALAAYATSRGLDVLVMGAYGHSRMRDFILGGATKSLVTSPPLPVFLSH